MRVRGIRTLLFAAMLVFAVPVFCLAQGPRLAEVVDSESRYICPMHSDHFSEKPGKCTKCGMTLVETKGAIRDEFVINTSVDTGKLSPGRKSRLKLQVVNPVTQVPVKQLYLQHEKPYHLFIVSSDLKQFLHIHPERQGDGSFEVDVELPKAGLYHVFSDVFPEGGFPQVIHQTLVTAGFKGDSSSLKARLEADVAPKTIDGLKFTLQTAPMKIEAGRAAILKLDIVNAADGKPAADLQPYLGAWGHCISLDEEAADFVHSHPMSTVDQLTGGVPSINPASLFFQSEFARPGIHRVWFQVQRAGKVITASFDVVVN